MSLNLTRVAFAVFALAVLSAGAVSPTGPGSGVRYATDAYPGFDSDDDDVKPSRKDPRWFHFINGPAKETAAEQLEYAASCEAAGSWRAARRGYDALVREWPTSPEAPKAQKALADLLLVHYLDSESAFEAYRYLLDFYSAQCDYDAIAERLYQVAGMMREEGKTILFFRFANTVDVRRAYESVVLRAPGAAFAPPAMLAIAALREEEDRPETAVTVYENLRGLYPDSPEASEALYREAKARREILRRREYNRERVQDTISFYGQARASGRLTEAQRTEVEEMLAEATASVEEAAYRAAKFYDSKTRTRRSAVNAYRRFLEEYPASDRASEVRNRLTELEGENAQ